MEVGVKGKIEKALTAVAKKKERELRREGMRGDKSQKSRCTETEISLRGEIRIGTLNSRQVCTNSCYDCLVQINESNCWEKEQATTRNPIVVCFSTPIVCGGHHRVSGAGANLEREELAKPLDGVGRVRHTADVSLKISNQLTSRDFKKGSCSFLSMGALAPPQKPPSPLPPAHLFVCHVNKVADVDHLRLGAQVIISVHLEHDSQHFFSIWCSTQTARETLDLWQERRRDKKAPLPDGLATG